MSYNPFDNYWTVATNPTQRWAGARGIYVATSDSAYIAWLAADATNAPTPIDTETNLWAVIADIALKNYLAGQGYGVPFFDVGNIDVTLTNPMVPEYNFAPTSADINVTLPQMNLPVSWPVNAPFLIINNGTRNVVIKRFSGVTLYTLFPQGVARFINSSIATTSGNLTSIVQPRGFYGHIFLNSTAAYAPSTILDTDTTLAANADDRVASQKAAKAYIAAGDVNTPTAISGGAVLIGSGATIDKRLKVTIGGTDYWIPASTTGF